MRWNKFKAIDVQCPIRQNFCVFWIGKIKRWIIWVVNLIELHHHLSLYNSSKTILENTIETQEMWSKPFSTSTTFATGSITFKTYDTTFKLLSMNAKNASFSFCSKYLKYWHKSGCFCANFITLKLLFSQTI